MTPARRPRVATTMRHRFLLAATLLLSAPLLALDGQPGMHDPSTVVIHDGKFDSYGTGVGLPISTSDDGWTWRRAGSLRDAVAGGCCSTIAS
jgi:arabinan endo-1,5-alpha-L-arabinosidase